ncbi:DUF1433 domain-containing protein [Terribacillus sp. DMT04]|uniref:DUF1433 domain-containing protein n=1 Tax=Terribacillus sp. DMT04 TaxID=2850441 RepID=UPI001C2CBC5A|nr:DUF1433 domain-containing protein [Terribacillus sp. DMT04]QXE01968.1 DUF1433 domain-containing protein [Terribacillus sp. DMT04]
MKKIYLSTLLLIISIILLGGCNANGESGTYDAETTKRAKRTAESYIENNYIGIESVELNEPYQSPMGSLSIDGTVNNKYGFTIDLNKDFTVSMIGTKKGFPAMKDECKEKDCKY